MNTLFTCHFTPKAPLLKAKDNTHANIPLPFLCSHHRRHRSTLVIPASSKNNDNNNSLGDELLDFMYAGKKLRKWYGQEGQVLPRDGNDNNDNDTNTNNDPTMPSFVENDTTPRDQILVVDNLETVPMAEHVVLQAILSREKVKIIVSDPATAQASFGPYVDVIPGSPSDVSILKKACRGVAAAILCGDVSPSLVSTLVAGGGVPHLVLLSAVGVPPPRGIASFFSGGNEAGVLGKEEREVVVAKSGAPCVSIVRVGTLVDREGGVSALGMSRISGRDSSGGGSSSRGGNGVAKGEVSREDAALVLVKRALHVSRVEREGEQGGGLGGQRRR